MIKSFADPEAATICQRQTSPNLPSDIQQTVLRTLRMINSATALNDLRLAARDGGEPGRFRIRINAHWQLHFEWRDGDIWNVALARAQQET